MKKQILNQSESWVRRDIEETIVEEIHQASSSSESIVRIYFIEGLAGTGKTVLARRIGQAFGSSDGYEPNEEGPQVWTGLHDVFDPDTSNNQGFEQRIQQAFHKRKVKFSKYEMERDFYDTFFKTGIRGPGLEGQRKAIEQGFADDLAEACRAFYPIVPLDTVERLSSTADPVQVELNLSTDTASLIGWLTFQIQKLPRGTFLFFGRKTSFLFKYLCEFFKIDANGKSSDGRYCLRKFELRAFDAQDLDAFFSYRAIQFSDLAVLLRSEIRGQLYELTGGNPLLLDLALQTLIECKDPALVLDELRKGSDLGDLLGQLLDAYHNTLANSSRKVLLHYLAIARNGLFYDLLKILEPEHGDQLWKELLNMQSLPFIKTRNVYVKLPSQMDRQPRLTFFFHDELYLLYECRKETAASIVDVSQRIVEWYDAQIYSIRRSDEILRKELRQTRETVPSAHVYDLLVESLLYRLRVHPRDGYAWFLMEEDKAIRNSISIGLDMRLRDALAHFMVNIGQEHVEPGLNLISPIDQENVRLNGEGILTDSLIDTIMLWVKRLSSRGDQNMAVKVGQTFFERVDAYLVEDPEARKLPYAEFNLWFGQALMYQGSIKNAIERYKEVLRILQLDNLEEKLGQNESQIGHQRFDAVRHSLVLGRAYNNLGYLCWMNLGQYRQAIHYFQQAIYWYRIASHYQVISLEEELANTNDNMGRVYSLLGFHERAKDLIQKALDSRKRLGFTYREALSANSLAQVLNNAGQPQQAIRFIDDALHEFRNAEAERGIGLGLITMGTIQRRQAEMWREQDEPPAQAIRYTDTAETNLRDAVRIFSETVQEPIRLVQAYNELGSCYRARHFVLKHITDTTPRYLESTFRLGVATYRRAIEYAINGGYYVEELDTLQDLAVLFFRDAKFAETKEQLQEIRKKIPPAYQIRPGTGLIDIPLNERIDAYYKLMGQVEMLEGAVVYQQGVLNARKVDPLSAVPIDDMVYKKTVAYYVLADIYFRRYSGEPYSLERTHGRMYKRFEHCTIDLVREIIGRFIPEMLVEYHLPVDSAKGLFADVFGVFD